MAPIQRLSKGLSCAGLLVLGVLAISVWPATGFAQTSNPAANAALEQAKALASSQAGQVKSNITSPANGMDPASLVPKYSPSASQSQYFANGQGDTKQPGANQVISCGNATSDELAGYAGKVCDATNFLVKQPSARPALAISKTDPLISGAAGQISGVKTQLPFSASSVTTSATCTTQTIPGQDQFKTEICQQSGSLSSSTCTISADVQVDAKYRYECQSQVKSITTTSCDRVMGSTCSGTPAIYTCPDGSHPADGICHSTVTSNEAASISGYTCPSGYTASGSNCVTTVTQTASIASYSCPSGQTISGSSCIQTITTTSAATPNYSCPSGQTLSGTSCIQTTNSSATPNYSCPAGATLSGSSCISTNNVSTPATIASYSCPSGYTLSGSTCTRTTTSAASIASYTCPTGYSLSGSTCTKTTTSSSSATPNYSCPSGYSLSGSTCSQTISTAGTPNYTCPSGYSINADHSCTKQLTTSPTVAGYYCPALSETPGAWMMNGPYAGSAGNYCYAVYRYPYSQSSVVNGYNTLASKGWSLYAPTSSYGIKSGYFYVYAKPSYNCPSGYTLSGSSCIQTTTTSATISSYSCPSGYTVSGSTCYTTQTTSASVSYSCPSGQTVSGSSCIQTITTTSAATPNYSCPSGQTLSGTSCIQTTNSSATPNYSCPAGSTLSGSSCISTNNVSTPATIASYSCPSGYTLSGSTCTRTTTSAASIASYTCPTGYSLSGSTCTKTTTSSSSATPNYSCPTGFTLSGSTCSQQLTQSGTPQYSCRAGGTLNPDNTCTYQVTTSSSATTSYSCSSGALTPGSIVSGTQTYMCCTDSITNNCAGLEAQSL